MKSLKSFLVVVLFFGVIANIQAGEPNTQKGSKGLFIGLNSLTDLSFDDTYLGALYFFADREAVAGIISIQSNTTEISGTSVTASMFVLGAAYTNYVFQKGSVGLYLAPYGAFFFGKEEADNLEMSGFDIGGEIGAEWWAFDNISLTAAISIGYNSLTTKNTETNFEVTESSLGFLGDGKGRFYLTYYF